MKSHHDEIASLTEEKKYLLQKIDDEEKLCKNDLALIFNWNNDRESRKNHSQSIIKDYQKQTEVIDRKIKKLQSGSKNIFSWIFSLFAKDASKPSQKSSLLFCCLCTCVSQAPIREHKANTEKLSV